MDTEEGFHGRTTGVGALSSKAAAPVKRLLLAVALVSGAASTEIVVAQTIVTDSTWLATNVAPAAGWNTDPSFDTTGWINAFVITPSCANGADCIWYDGQFSATQLAWLRKTFTISVPVSSCVLVGGIDDDCDIYVNGNLVLSDHNGLAGTFGPIDVSAQVVPGVNLIAGLRAQSGVFLEMKATINAVQIVTLLVGFTF